MHNENSCDTAASHPSRNPCGTAAPGCEKSWTTAAPGCGEEILVQIRRAEALTGFRLASPLHEKKRHPARTPGVGVAWRPLAPQFRISARASVGPKMRLTPIPCAAGRRAAQGEVTQIKFHCFEPLTNRVKIPLCQTRSPQLLQKSLSAIATIPMSIKTVF